MRAVSNSKVSNLLRDQRGSVFIEYLVVAACCIVITGALVGLTRAVRTAETRATEVIESDLP